MTTSLAALSAPATPQGHLEVALTYDAMQANLIAGSSFWMQGSSVQIEGRSRRGIGVVADIAGVHDTNVNSSGVGINMVTATLGPRYTWSPAYGRLSLFGQSLAGEAFGFNGLFPRRFRSG